MPTVADMLPFLRCPVTGQNLTEAETDLLASIQKRQSEGRLADESGAPVMGEITSLLVRADGLLAYLVVADIPVLLPGSGIPV